MTIHDTGSCNTLVHPGWHGHLARVSWAGRPCHEGFRRRFNALKAPLLGLVALALGAGCAATRSVSYAEAAPGTVRRARMVDRFDDPFGDAMYAMAPAAGGELADAEAAPSGGGVGAQANASGAPQAAVAQRLMTFEGTLRMVVPDVEAAQRATEALAVESGGHLQSISGRAVTVRIPAARFREVLDAIERMGEVTSRDVRGTDVTETMLDLDLRLKTMREMRERLVALLDRSDKVEDLLAVEKELQRVTVELERMQGRIRYLKDAIAYSTLTVHFNAVGPHTGPAETIPFAWIRSLERELHIRPGLDLEPARRWGRRRPASIELPAEAVILEQSRERLQAMLPGGVMLLLRRHRNFDGAGLSFWEPLVRRHLSAGRSLAVGAVGAFELDDGWTGLRVKGTRAVGREPHAYALWLVVTDRNIYCLEVIGTEARMEQLGQELAAAAQSLRVR